MTVRWTSTSAAVRWQADLQALRRMLASRLAESRLRDALHSVRALHCTRQGSLASHIGREFADVRGAGQNVVSGIVGIVAEAIPRTQVLPCLRHDLHETYCTFWRSGADVSALSTLDDRTHPFSVLRSACEALDESPQRDRWPSIRLTGRRPAPASAALSDARDKTAPRQPNATPDRAQACHRARARQG